MTTETERAQGAPAGRDDGLGGPPLDDFFPYLVNLITQTIAIHFQKTGRPLGITIERWRVLFVLMQGEALRASRLSAQTGIEASTLSHLLSRMARDGLVTRRKDAEDARGVVVELTEDGRALAERMLPLARQYEAVALAGMSAAEARRVKATLRRIAKNLDALDASIVPSLPGDPARGPGEQKTRR